MSQADAGGVPDARGLSALLRDRRADLGITQAELARRAGMSVRAVRYLEQGRIRNPRVASVRQLVAALDAVAGEPAPVRIGVLGPLLVEVGDARHQLGDTRPARLLGLLALRLNRPVSMDEIVDVLWEGRPPRSRADLVGSYVRRLRALLGPGVRLVATGRGGYRLELAAGLDVLRFDELVAAARAAQVDDDLEAAFDTLAEALDCWRGPVLADQDSLRGHPAAGALSRQRLSATLAYADLGIALGRHGPVATRLAAMRDDEPLHEGLHARLMVALAGSGRQAAALELFDDLRVRLSAELGIEPGPEIRRAQLHVLRQEIPAAAGWLFGGSNYLPRDIEDFVGRASEAGRLTDAAGGPAVFAISGMAGVGKTALAVHFGHRLADRFPDGQLFVDLHGSADRPLPPAAALDSLLRQLGVDGRRIPEWLDQRAALWRSLLVGRDVLVVLDDAADAAQVRPLLPAGASCLVLITSRVRLGSIDAVDTLSLDVLPPTEAVRLFTRIVGPARTSGHQAEVAEIARLCGFLPLALRIAAARLRDRPLWTLTGLVTLLRDEHRRLPELSIGDRSVSAAFTLSYNQLSDPQQRLFRLLGEWVGAELDAYVAAALAGGGMADTERLLDELVDVHLLYQPSPGRYRFHDLIRDHARSTGAAEPQTSREAAAVRLVDYHLHVAGQAADLLEPTRKRLPPIGTPPTQVPPLATGADALAWFEAERANLGAVIAAAAQRGHAEHGWRLAQTLWRFFFIRGHVHDWIETHTLALDLTQRVGNPMAEAEIRKNLGLGHWRRGDFAEAIEQHHRALDLDRANHDGWGEAKTHNHLGFIHARGGSHEAALTHHQHAVTLYRAADDRCGEARALVGLGDLHFHAGRGAEAAADFQRALDLAREVDDGWGEALAAVGLGFTTAPAQAQRHLERALELTRATGDRWGESMALIGLGKVRQAQHAPAAAMNCFQQAITLAQEVGDRWWERMATTGLGRVCTELGRHAEALTHHERALTLARALDDKAAEAEALADLDNARSDGTLPRTW